MDDFVVLLDGLSRERIKDPLTFLSSGGLRVITSIDELNLDTDKKVLIFEGLAYDTVALNRLLIYLEVKDIEVVCIGADSFALSTLGKRVRVFRCPLDKVTYDVIRYACTGDISTESKESYGISDELRRFADQIQLHPEQYSEQEIVLAKGLAAMYDAVEWYRTTLHEREQAISSLEDSLAATTAEYGRVVNAYCDILHRSKVLNQTLRDYEVVLTKNFYNKVDVRGYANHPQILYLKEYEDFVGIDELAETLFQVYTQQFGMSVKVIRVFDNVGQRKIAVLPDYYKVLYNTYPLTSVVEYDFIGKIGESASILDFIMTNRYGLQMLIVVDSKSYDDTVLDGDFLQFSLCRSKDHADRLGLDKTNTILCEESEEFMWWKPGSDFVEMASSEAIRKIVSIMRVFSGIV